MNGILDYIKKRNYLVILLVIVFAYVIFLSSNYFYTSKCREKVVGIGPCDMMLRGIYYNNEVNRCEMMSVSGCSVKKPFKSLDECQSMCE